VSLNIGLADENGDAILYKCDSYSRIGSLTKLPESQERFQEEVELKRLDDVFPGLGISHIDLLKIDVEGHELDVLRGSQNLLERRLIKVIQFEFGEFNLYSRVFFKDLYDFLSRHGFAISAIKFGGLIELEKYKPRYEIFAPTNFVAVLISEHSNVSKRPS